MGFGADVALMCAVLVARGRAGGEGAEGADDAAAVAAGARSEPSTPAAVWARAAESQASGTAPPWEDSDERGDDVGGEAARMAASAADG